MKISRPAVAGFALATVMGLAGCNASGGSGATPVSPAGSAPVSAPAPTPTADPVAELTAAAEKLEEQSVRMTMTMGTVMSASGTADPKNDKADLVMKVKAGKDSIDMTMRLVGPDLYMRFGGSLGAELGSKWLHIDASKIPDDSEMNVDKLFDAGNFLSGLAEVEKTGARSFKGELDLTKARHVDTGQLGALGVKARAVPFTAEVDDQGRLTVLVIDMAALGMPARIGKEIRAEYSDFGAPVTVQAPKKSQVREMPAEMRKAFIGGPTSVRA
jgi:hypothetical protein